MSRFLGIDFGVKRIGLALSDPTGMIAFPFDVLLAEKSQVETAAALYARVHGSGPFESIVIGIPLNDDGTENLMCARIKTFTNHLKVHFSCPIVFQDESFTSEDVDARMRAEGVPKEKRQEKKDKLAAALILQDYLDQKKHGCSKPLPPV